MNDARQNSFFDGFKWAVPRVFADPVAACRFELGDTLYEHPDAYHMPWDEAIAKSRIVQVLEPSRGVSGKSSGADDSAFADSWQQEVVLELHAPGAAKPRLIKTSQGRLFTFLWQGDQGVLDDASSEPKAPVGIAELKKQLKKVAALFMDGDDPGNPVTRFFMATDEASGLQREKFQKVENSLQDKYDVRLQKMSAQDLGLSRMFLPTAQVVCFSMDKASPRQVVATLQAALYKPAAGKKTEAVRFRLNAHGLLLPEH